MAAPSNGKPSQKVFHTSEVNSLLDLQTEFLRKKREATGARSYPANFVNRTKNKIFALSKAEKDEKRNVQESRSTRIRRNEEAIKKEEGERIKRQKILEEKTAIYERMSKGETLVHSDGTEAEFLVNFQLKKRELEEKMANDSCPSSSSKNDDEFEELETPLIVHYDHTEEKGRVFGPSHVSFASSTEEERLKKMQEVKNLTEETAKNREKHKKVVDAKRVANRERLNRIRARKGLPLIESSSESDDDEIKEDLIDIPLPPDAQPSEHVSNPKQINMGIREWDRGKVGYKKWISAQREERNDEFQPPSFYYSK